MIQITDEQLSIAHYAHRAHMLDLQLADARSEITRLQGMVKTMADPPVLPTEEPAPAAEEPVSE